MHQVFRFHRTVIVSLSLLAISGLRADVTLRYKMDLTPNASLPAQLTQQMTKSLDANLLAPMTQQFKNNKVVVSFGKLNSIVDFTRQEITLLDKEGKRYATIPAAKYGDEVAKAMPTVPDAAKAMMAMMKGHFESKATGRTSTIQGVEADEREIVISIDAPPIPNVPPGPMMRLVMHVWMAKASEAARVPAIKEMSGYNLFSIAGLDPLTAMGKAFEQLPGVADAFADLMKEFQSGKAPAFLGMQVDMFMPMIGAMMKQMPAGAANPFGANFDADASLVKVNQELSELSTAPIPDSVFQIPEGYKSAPAADILKDMMPKLPAAGQQ